MKRIIAVTGGRDVTPSSRSLIDLFDLVTGHPESDDDGVEVHYGGYPTGVDAAVAQYCVGQQIPAISNGVDWDQSGHPAGPFMIYQPGVELLCAWPGGRRTRTCIKIAHSKRVPVQFMDRPFCPVCGSQCSNTCPNRQGFICVKCERFQSGEDLRLDICGLCLQKTSTRLARIFDDARRSKFGGVGYGWKR